MADRVCATAQRPWTAGRRRAQKNLDAFATRSARSFWIRPEAEDLVQFKVGHPSRPLGAGLKSHRWLGHRRQPVAAIAVDRRASPACQSARVQERTSPYPSWPRLADRQHPKCERPREFARSRSILGACARSLGFRPGASGVRRCTSASATVRPQRGGEPPGAAPHGASRGPAAGPQTCSRSPRACGA